MRCPECDSDSLEEKLDRNYDTIYTCKHCGCEFGMAIEILKEGKEE